MQGKITISVVAMKRRVRIDFLTALISTLAITAAGLVNAVEVTNLAGLEDIFGRYAPGGDCKRQPQVLVELKGLTFSVAGATVKVTNPEYAAGYGPADYAGISKWIFPFRIPDGYPILMTFNAGEKKGVLLIEAQDEGWQGGPPLSPTNKALVGGSPYGRCK